MGNRLVDLKTARVLISNDDGIDAEGIAVLEAATFPLVGEMLTVAPESGQSGASHKVSFKERLTVTRVGPGERYKVNGTPADSVILGLQTIFAENAPDLVLSGVNKGLNLGDDVFASGTVGVAIQACLQHVPAIAFSAYNTHGVPVEGVDLHDTWETASHVIPDVLDKLSRFGWPRDTFFNVNIPNRPYSDIAGIVATRQGRMDFANSFVVQDAAHPGEERSFYMRHIGGQGVRDGESDYQAIKKGFVTVTPVRVEITDHDVLASLSGALA